MEWISVKDRLPEFPRRCLIVIDNRLIEFGSFIPEFYQIGGNMYRSNNPRWDIPEQWKPVTHWMPLPKPPNSQEMIMQWIDINNEDIHKNNGEYFIIKLFNLHSNENSFDFDIVKFEQEQFVNCDGRPYYKKEISHWMPLPDAPS